MSWERDGTHWPDEVRDGDEVEQGEQQPPAPTRHEWTDDDDAHYVLYRDANGLPHHEDGPAWIVTWPDGYQHEAWSLHGKRHRKGGPALASTFPDGTGYEEWWEDGKFIRRERIPAPTRAEWTDVGIHHVRYHDAERRLHRKDGPAVTETWPDGYRREEWRWRDKRHRKDGPAVTATLPDGSRREEWWEDGKFIREERTPAPTRNEWTDVDGAHHVRYRDAELRLHRADGPADTETWSDGYQYKACYWHGKLHCKSGPAVTTVYRDGSQQCEWWEDGKFIREERTPAPDRGDG